MGQEAAQQLSDYTIRGCPCSKHKLNNAGREVHQHQGTVRLVYCCAVRQVAAEHSLQLQPMERVVTVVWQNTQQGPPLEPYQAAAAILTTQVCMVEGLGAAGHGSVCRREKRIG